MLDQATIADAATRLQAAEASCRLIRQFSLEFPGMTIADAYAIQSAWIELKLAQGRVVRGHKIGLTSRAMQQSIGIDEPDHGVLLDDMFFHDGATIPPGRFTAPRVEMELAFVPNKRLAGPNCTIFDIISATDFVTPALELLDTRLQRVDPETGSITKIVDTISDNAANAGIIMGGRPFRPMEADMRWIAGLLYRNGVIEESGVAAAVLNHPANGIAWLANKLAAHGASLAAGEVILSGSFIRAVGAKSGDTLHADYGPYGSISCYFG